MAVFCVSMTQDYMDEQIFVIPEKLFSCSRFFDKGRHRCQASVVVMKLRSFELDGFEMIFGFGILVRERWDFLTFSRHFLGLIKKIVGEIDMKYDFLIILTENLMREYS